MSQTTVHKPLIDREDVLPDETILLKLRPEVCRDLRAYGVYASSSVSHVAAAALKRLFSADKGFREFVTMHPEAGKETPAEHKEKRVRKEKVA